MGIKAVIVNSITTKVTIEKKLAITPTDLIVAEAIIIVFTTKIAVRIMDETAFNLVTVVPIEGSTAANGVLSG